MPNFGLALSGGGFRATLYHLGAVRYLRDAGLLSCVTHITSVSGGSVLAGHLVLNWDRYCGDAKDFDEAAQEILDFVALDVRNRIVRRYPFVLARGLARRITRVGSKRRLTRTMLLENHYKRYLYGDTCLFQLPASPELHILSTSLSGGGLSSFTRRGLLMEQRQSSGGLTMAHHHVGLVTVPMAVAASSAFPGFFPPLELSAEVVGAQEGDFQTQFFTDGGVYDNLGVRMFRYLQQTQATTITDADFTDLEGAISAWNQAAESKQHTPLRRLTELYASVTGSPDGRNQMSAIVEQPQQFYLGLERLLAQSDLYEDKHLGHLIGANGNDNGNGNERSHSDRFSKNRRLLQVAFQKTTGEDVLRNDVRGFDAIIASDAGKKFQVSRPERVGGFLRTAMRSSYILMDRVWQLEKEHFTNAKGFVFSPITRIVSEEEDPTALHPEVQIQVSHMRTDMDRFSPREVSGLVRHGYCVARHSLATRPDVFANYHVENPTWDPTSHVTSVSAKHTRDAKGRGAKAIVATIEARKLQKSSRRQYWSLFTAPRDWVAYLYIPVIVLLLGVLPWFAWRTYRHARVNAMLTYAIAEAREDYGKMLTLLEYGPIAPWKPIDFVEASEPSPLFEEQGLDIISDSRITDLRKWYVAEGSTIAPKERRIYICRYVTVRKTSVVERETALRMQSLWDFQNILIRCDNSELKPVLRRCNLSVTDGKGPYVWEVKLDFRDVAVGQTVDIVVEAIIPHNATNSNREKTEWWRFEVDGSPEVATSWILLPENKRYANFGLVRYEKDKPDSVTIVQPTRQASIRNGSILNWSVVHPEPGFTYSCRWTYDL